MPDWPKVLGFVIAVATSRWLINAYTRHLDRQREPATYRMFGKDRERRECPEQESNLQPVD